MGSKLARIITETINRLGSGLLAFFLPVARFVIWMLSFAKGHLNHAIAFVVVLYFLVAILNPFNIDENADAGAANTINAVLSPFYGELDRVGQQQITVVLIQPESMNLFGDPFWPLEYEIQANIVERIADFGPKAVFLDFYYSEPHRETEINSAFFAKALDPLNQTAEDGPQKADPQMMQIMNLQMDAADPVILNKVQRFADRLHESRITPPSKSDSGGEIINFSYLPILFGPIAAHPAFAPLRAFDDDPLIKIVSALPEHRASVGLTIEQKEAIEYPSSSDGGRRQAALALFEIWCDRTSVEITKGKCRNLDDWIDNKQPLSVEWGFGSLNTLRDKEDIALDSAVLNQPCGASGFGPRLMKYTSFIVSSFVHGFSGEEPYRQKGCSYHEIIPAQYLFDGLNEAQLDAMLKDRIVLVGADFRGFADSFDTPIYRRVPGVMIHAMALDNLMEHGRSAQRFPQPVLGGADQADIVSGIFLAIALLIVIAIHTRAKKTDAKSDLTERIASYIAVIVSFLLLGIGLSVYVLHWPPFNIVEFLFTLLGGVFVLEVLVPSENVTASEPTTEN